VAYQGLQVLLWPGSGPGIVPEPVDEWRATPPPPTLRDVGRQWRFVRVDGDRSRSSIRSPRDDTLCDHARPNHRWTRDRRAQGRPESRSKGVV
jgi:hypothetical protein